ncbi:hypothetical protein PYCCODRAFT_1407694 [Trametes coccinea BRFM310]|uniref:Uncharacterized protein n=1 Tax=Trametes coccinea (strain BRFM310) TaxID=1353009 RepID=A0A1Y2IU21_TRAC3|nr:hypothetical protein PYCCODRAFT_1407694 [Trametes coccinea BRFM310]
MSAATQSIGASDGSIRGENMSNDNVGPIHREATPPLTASQRPEQRDAIDQSKDIAVLATIGIKVRDFAYENTLPPVTIVPRFAVQTQPRPRMLKRTRDMLEGNDDGEESDVEDPSVNRTWFIDSNGTGVSHGSRYRKKTQALARTLTEPADEVPPSQGFNTREGAFFVPPSQRPTSPEPQSQPVPLPTTPHRPNRLAQTASLSPLTIHDNISPPRHSQQGESQETEPWVDTPLVTPNGSLQWPTVQNTSAIPESQLESMLPQLPGDDVTLSQLGFSPERSQHPRRSSPFRLSPAGAPSRRRPDPQLPPPAEFRHHTASPTRSRHSSGSPSRRSPQSGSDGSGAGQEPASPRYHLRQRRPGGMNTTARGAAQSGRRAQSQTRSAHQRARKTENEVPPAKKKQKASPPADPSARTTRYGRRRNGEVGEVR